MNRKLTIFDCVQMRAKYKWAPAWGHGNEVGVVTSTEPFAVKWEDGAPARYGMQVFKRVACKRPGRRR